MTSGTARAAISAALLCAAVWPAHAQWKWSSDLDKMTGKKAVLATVRSTESLSLPFPYAGSNFAELTVRQHPSYGLDVIFDVQKGQITCHAFDACQLMIRFDEQKAEAFSGSPPSDHSAQSVFLTRASVKRFLDRAAKAKRILVQATYYQAGTLVSEFSTPTGLAWPPPK